MGQNSRPELNEIAHLFSQIQEYIDTLPLDLIGVVQLFFDSQLDICEISHVYERSPDEIKGIINNFLSGLITKSHGLQRLLAGSYKGSTEVISDLEAEVKLPIEMFKAPDSVGQRIREIIGAAIRISIPQLHSKLDAEIISRVYFGVKNQGKYSAKFIVDLRESNFILGKQKIAAGIEVAPEAKTCSDGTVIIERGVKKVKVNFHIVLQEKSTQRKRPEYVITFHNLPVWATPVAFSFVGLDYHGNIKEYVLPSELRKGRLCFWVENQEQEELFIDRTKTYIFFDISYSLRG